MNKNLLFTIPLFLFFLFVSEYSFSQNFLVKQWDSRFGGNDDDHFTAFQQTMDGGYILGGYSFTGANGDKTQPSRGGADYWIVKIDSLGFYQWDKRFGGNLDDKLFTLEQTADHGFMLGGYSFSGANGDKTQATQGYDDYWIVKTDSVGNYEWDRRFGGTSEDDLYSLHQTGDHGYILGGDSYSGIGGDKTQDHWGFYGGDYWLVKIDSAGNYQWDRRFGTTNYEYFKDLKETNNGGYILGGYTDGWSDGDKTQTSWGYTDYWIVKVDSLGNYEWDKRFGGTDYDFFNSLDKTIDGGYILAGASSSGIGGDKTQSTWWDTLSYPYDWWVVKIDSLGNYQWDQRYGGTDKDDEFGNITQEPNGEFLLAGTSYSPISGNKTENNFGQEQIWILEADESGNKLWDKTIFTDGHEEIGYAIQTRDGCYAAANWTEAGVGGYKTQGSYGSTENYWIVKLCDTTCVDGLSPVSIFSSADSSACETLCTDFYTKSFNCPTKFQWTFEGATPDSSTIPNPLNICYNTPGSYDVTLITTNEYGSDTLVVQNFIHIFTNPTPSISADGLLLTCSPAYSGYQWYVGETLIIGATNQLWDWPGCCDPAIVLVTDSNGCMGRDTLEPVSQFSAPLTEGCPGTCFDFTNLSLNANYYQWFFEGGTPASTALPYPTNICYANSGTFDVTLFAHLGFLTDTLVLTDFITIYPSLNISISQNGNVLTCNPPANSYQWYNDGDIIPGATDQEYTTSNWGWYSVEVTDSIGCTFTATLYAEPPFSQSEFSSSATSGCPGSCFDFSNTSVNATGYQWFFPGGSPPSSIDQNPVNICYANPGSYDVTLVSYNDYSSDTLIQTGYLTIFPPVSFSISQNGNFLTCDPAASSYQWLLNGNEIPGATSQSLYINEEGNYSVDVIDSNGCSSFAAIEVSLVPSPNFSAADSTVCEKFCVNYFDQSTNDPVSWYWIFEGGNPSSSTDQNPANICYAVPGIYDVTLITTNNFGNDTLQLMDIITVYPTPPFPTITQDGYTLTSSPASSYQWQFNSTDIPGATNQSYDVQQTGLYTVIVSDSNSCVNSMTVYVLITGISDMLNGLRVKIYPNPSAGSFTVELLNFQMAEEISLIITNSLGEEIYHRHETTSSLNWKKEIHLTDVPQGIYLLNIQSNSTSWRKTISITN